MVQLKGVTCPWCSKKLPPINKKEEGQLDIPCVYCGNILSINYYPHMVQRLIVDRFRGEYRQGPGVRVPKGLPRERTH